MNQQDAKTKQKIVTIPNILSCFRICLIPLIVWLYCAEQNFLGAGYVLILSGATDIVDGFVARHFNMISDLGKMLDPFADKLTQAAMMICLFTRFPLIIVPLILMAVKEIFMSVTGFLIIKNSGKVLSANWHGKVATCLLYGMMILHVFWNEISCTVSAFSIAVCTVMIGISFVLYGISNVKALKKSE